MIQSLLVADDLTGACDAAVHFAARGLQTVVDLPGHSYSGAAHVIARTTESRDFAPQAVRDALAKLAAEFSALPSRIFKKIDSTMRGNVGMEVAAARDSFDCDAAVVCPAFPAMHRVVRHGLLRVTSAPGFAPLDVAAQLAEQSGERCAHTAPEGLLARLSHGDRLISVDAYDDSDLDAIAAALTACGRRVLWAGSAGLASGLARLLATAASHHPVAALSHRGPVLFCIGSDHPVSMAQQEALLNQRACSLLPPETPAELIAAALTGGHALLRIARGQLPDAVGALRPAAIFACGGDTASLVFRAAGARAIRLHDELAPGVPRGTVVGGGWDGVPVVTKSGGFGGRDTLIIVADYFHAII